MKFGNLLSNVIDIDQVTLGAEPGGSAAATFPARLADFFPIGPVVNSSSFVAVKRLP